jgi:hypothetical protein
MTASSSGPASGPSAGTVIAQTLERPDDTLEDLERYYGPSYADGLYRTR